MKLAKNLNPNLFSDKIEKVPNREGFGEGLVEAAKLNKNVVALSADLTESTRVNLFAAEFPERFVQVGVAEQNMASVASGLAAVGKIPFIASYAMFSPGRNWEQIRTTIAYNNQNVKIIGAHSGISVGPDGATHQAVEDMAIMRAMPNMSVIAPADIHEAKKAVMFAAEYKSPLYIRLGRAPVPVVTTATTPFEFGKALLAMERDQHTKNTVGIVVTGSLLFEALLAGKKLNEEGIGTSVLHMPTVKPLDTDALLTLAENHDLIITLEEHQIAGGLGGAVSEFLGETRPTRIKRLGVNNEFGQSGEPEELIAHYKMDHHAVLEAAHSIFNLQ